MREGAEAALIAVKVHRFASPAAGGGEPVRSDKALARRVGPWGPIACHRWDRIVEGLDCDSSMTNPGIPATCTTALEGFPNRSVRTVEKTAREPLRAKSCW